MSGSRHKRMNAIRIRKGAIHALFIHAASFFCITALSLSFCLSFSMLCVGVLWSLSSFVDSAFSFLSRHCSLTFLSVCLPASPLSSISVCLSGSVSLLVCLAAENQVYSAEEKRALAQVNFEEKTTRERTLLAKFRKFLQEKDKEAGMQAQTSEEQGSSSSSATASSSSVS